MLQNKAAGRPFPHLRRMSQHGLGQGFQGARLAGPLGLRVARQVSRADPRTNKMVEKNTKRSEKKRGKTHRCQEIE